MSIRTRLTIWYSVILVLGFVLFGAGVYVSVSVTMVGQVDASLEQSASSIADQIKIIMNGDGRVISLPQFDVFRASTVYVEAIDTKGKIRGRSTNVGTFENQLDPATITELSQKPATEQKPIYNNVQHTGAPPLRVYTYPLVVQDTGELFGYLQVAASVEDIELTKHGLLLTLLVVGALGLVVSAVAGAAMARRALRPVTEITNTALEIYRTEDLNRRVEVETNDEVGRLASAFNEMLDRLTRLFRAQQRFVADVSHEMRTPLTVIRGNVDLLRMGCADEESLDAITSESERMTRMVSNLLLLSQADAGALPMRMEPLDLAPLINNVVRSGNIMADGRVEVTANVADDLEVLGDSDRLKQVLLNLVDNAIKHTPEGGKVTVEASSNGGTAVHLVVKDTGIGIPPQDLAHVFERFYRVDKSRSRAQGGAGLGLAIAKSFVEAHGGRIEVQSTVGAGTSFIVTLPAYRPNLV
ncbi:MAG: ATP-binding protein [Chloroflexi bacterium]|nr:ATP-binding protein [Chloroflexota bacterium]MCL5273178.1 ATP-binding protein [Chloroflexota bacterium]